MVPFSRRKYGTYSGIKFGSNGHIRPESTLAQSMTAINGTIRLQSDAEVRYSSLLSSYIYHFDFGSWPTTLVHHATGKPMQVSDHSFFYTSIIVSTHAFPADHERMGIDFAAAFYKMSKLGADPNNVSIRWYSVKISLSH